MYLKNFTELVSFMMKPYKGKRNSKEKRIVERFYHFSSTYFHFFC